METRTAITCSDECCVSDSVEVQTPEDALEEVKKFRTRMQESHTLGEDTEEFLDCMEEVLQDWKKNADIEKAAAENYPEEPDVDFEDVRNQIVGAIETILLMTPDIRLRTAIERLCVLLRDSSPELVNQTELAVRSMW